MKTGEFFTLEKVLFVRSVVVAQPGFRPPENRAPAPALNITNNIDVQRDDQQPGRFMASMRTVINENKADTLPYHIDMECVCALRQIDDTLSPQEAMRGATITAHSVLYGAIREAVAWITGRQPFGAINLGLSVLRSNPAEAEGTSSLQGSATNETADAKAPIIDPGTQKS